MKGIVRKQLEIELSKQAGVSATKAVIQRNRKLAYKLAGNK